MSITELSDLQDLKEIQFLENFIKYFLIVYDFSTNLFGIDLIKAPEKIAISTSGTFKYRHSWVLIDIRVKDKTFYRSTRGIDLSDSDF